MNWLYKNFEQAYRKVRLSEEIRLPNSPYHQRLVRKLHRARARVSVDEALKVAAKYGSCFSY